MNTGLLLRLLRGCCPLSYAKLALNFLGSSDKVASACDTPISQLQAIKTHHTALSSSNKILIATQLFCQLDLGKPLP